MNKKTININAKLHKLEKIDASKKEIKLEDWMNDAIKLKLALNEDD